ncbi:MAG: type II secretion system F family protein [Planctomycetes bacterium]|nr:type II secretion system F family protein [Planctomycetota bacterium]
MPDFSYTARQLNGEKVTGVIAAATEREAINVLAGQSLFPLQVTSRRASDAKRFGGRVKGQVVATTFSQLASLLRSGVPLLRSIRVLRDQTPHKTLKEVLGDIHDRVEDGATLADAMSRHERIFSEMGVSMVRAGGEGGFLEEALDRVAQFTEEFEDLKARTAGALAYPMFLATAGVSIVAGLMIFFVPKFALLFDRLRERGELPKMTDWLLATSELMRSRGWLVLIAVVITFFVLRARLATESGRRFWDRVKLRVPGAGPIFQNLAVSRFCRVLGTLLRNGVPILKSLDIARDSAGNRMLSEAIIKAAENISSGERLASPLRASGYFPADVVEMIAVAEESNTLDAVLVEIANSLEKGTSRRLDLFVRLLEPMMLLVLAGFVLFVVFALLLPVIKMSSTL